MSKIWGNIDMSDIKRCYVEGAVVTQECECGETIERDIGEDYLSYPLDEITVGFWCEACDEEYEQTYTFQAIALLERVDG